VCAVVGSVDTVQYIFPCLETALVDSDEFVVAEAVKCFRSLIELGLLSLAMIQESVKCTAPLLLHPAVGIRMSVAEVSRDVGLVLSPLNEITDSLALVA